MPVSLFEPGYIDGKALISNPIGIEGQKPPVQSLQMDGKGGAHQDVPEIDGKCCQDDC
jgi:hypothetical protein